MRDAAKDKVLDSPLSEIFTTMTNTMNHSWDMDSATATPALFPPLRVYQKLQEAPEIQPNLIWDNSHSFSAKRFRKKNHHQVQKFNLVASLVVQHEMASFVLHRLDRISGGIEESFSENP